MNVLIAYYSMTGNTKKAAEIIAQKFSNEHTVKIERIEPVKPYTKVSAYTLGCAAAIAGKGREIKPAEFNWSPYDLVIIGTPVWAGRPTPPLNEYISKIKEGANKHVLTFSTDGGMVGATAESLEEKLNEHDVMFLDFGHVTVKKSWDETENTAAEKLADEFLEIIASLPREISGDAKSIRQL